jgi:hypothetical protein
VSPRESKLDVSWRHVNRALLSLERLRDRQALPDHQTAWHKLDELERRADELLDAIEEARVLF